MQRISRKTKVVLCTKGQAMHISDDENMKILNIEETSEGDFLVEYTSYNPELTKLQECVANRDNVLHSISLLVSDSNPTDLEPEERISRIKYQLEIFESIARKEERTNAREN